MSVTEDRRVRMTKKILKEALIEIMHTKSIHEISIKKICEVADINRSTFYHHYQSPTELYDDIIEDIAKELSTIYDKNKNKGNGLTAIIAEMLTYIEENRNLFLVVLSDKGNISVGERLSNIVGEFSEEDKFTELSYYCTQFISAGVANIIWLWINNPDRLPPKEVASLLNIIIMHGLKRAMAISKKAPNSQFIK